MNQKSKKFRLPRTSDTLTNNNRGSYPTQLIVERSADNWVVTQYGFIESALKNVVPPGSRSVKVYVLQNGKAEQINRNIQFMEGHLWATVADTDVKIVYYCSCTKAPFESLDIKIVIE
jgi:hypothetical protein